MKIVLLFIFLTVTFACTTHKQATIKKHLKEYAFCRCLDMSVTKFVGKDSMDISSYFSLVEVEQFGIFADYRNKIYQSLDSAAAKIITEEIRGKSDSIGRHEDVVGKTGYKLSCLQFYESKKLDSLIKSLKKEIKEQQKGIKGW